MHDAEQKRDGHAGQRVAEPRVAFIGPVAFVWFNDAASESAAVVEHGVGGAVNGTGPADGVEVGVTLN